MPLNLAREPILDSHSHPSVLLGPLPVINNFFNQGLIETLAGEQNPYENDRTGIYYRK